MGRAVSIHPLAVVLAISTGGVVAGIVGALLAVPTVAFFNNAIQVLLAKDPAAEVEQQSMESNDTNDKGIMRATSDSTGDGSN
jgi:predicted PurR-regulated permease PerM